jgi:hypothetical protein
VVDIHALPWKRSEINVLGVALGKIFSLTDKGPVKWFLAMSITRDIDNKMMYLSQSLYIDYLLLKLHGMQDSKPVITPTNASDYDHETKGAEGKDASQFRSIVNVLVEYNKS